MNIFNPLKAVKFKRLIRRFLPKRLEKKLVEIFEELQSKRKPTEVFSEIYRDGLWESAESRSGHGSDLANTVELRNGLIEIINKFAIKSIVDAPCGDFNWMRTVPLNGTQYLGMDVVPDLVKDNNSKFASGGIEFRFLDIVESIVPRADLIICRDCLPHLSLRQAMAALENFKLSGSRYLLTSTYPHVQVNSEAKTGSYRPLNLEVAPFLMKPPLLKIVENPSVETTDVHYGKTMALWDLSS